MHESVRSELEKIPGVEGVSFTWGMPGVQDGMMRWGRGAEGNNVSTNVMVCDWKFPRVLGIDIVEVRDFTEKDGDCYIVNEVARDCYDWIGIDKPLVNGDLPVVGICKNFNVFSARKDNSQEPTAFVVFGELYKEWNRNLYKVVVRVGKNTDKIAVKQQLEETLSKACPYEDVEPELRFMDEQLQQTYTEEFRFIRQVEIFSIICLLITLVGVFCLTMYETEYRRKEIGIRKVLGNSTSDIITMFCRRYTLLIIIAFVFAAPLAYIMAEQWLQNFAERTAIHWWLFPVAFIAVSGIVLATVALQTYQTANENPVNSIKTE